MFLDYCFGLLFELDCEWIEAKAPHESICATNLSFFRQLKCLTMTVHFFADSKNLVISLCSEKLKALKNKTVEKT